MLRASIFVLLIVASTVQPARAQYSTVCNANSTYQTIDGFGAAQPGGQEAKQDFATVLYTYPYPATVQQVFDWGYRKDVGIGLSILRMKVVPTLELTQGVWNYTDTAQVWVMQQATQRAPTKIIASVWSAPGWMKSNGSTKGGNCYYGGAVCTLDDDCSICSNNVCANSGTSCTSNANCTTSIEHSCVSGNVLSHKQDFATYLSHFSSQYASANGVSIYAVSIANEPDTTADTQYHMHDPNDPRFVWDTCSWSNSQLDDFTKNYLAPTFAADHITTKVIAPEAANWDYVDHSSPSLPSPVGPYLSTIEGDSSALNRIDIAAGHLYGGTAGRVFNTTMAPWTRGCPHLTPIISIACEIVDRPLSCDRRRDPNCSCTGTL